MPIFSYFLFVGAALTGILLWLGNENPPNPAAPAPSNSISRFKPEPENEHARVTAVNFAAARERTTARPIKPVKSEGARRAQKMTTSSPEPALHNKYAEFPQGNLSIH
jgi:hypothetical protein